VSDNSESTISLAVDIVAAFVANNTIAPGDIAGLLQSVKVALDGTVQATAAPTVLEPAVALRKLVTPDAIFCAECGKKFKSLKRHLASDHDLTPDAYRSKWGLKSDSPMVAPNYSATRSALAKSTGLGQLSRKAASPPPPSPVKQKAKPHPKPSKSAPK
jgi:predicted transcriptional regulator